MVIIRIVDFRMRARAYYLAVEILAPACRISQAIMISGDKEHVHKVILDPICDM